MILRDGNNRRGDRRLFLTMKSFCSLEREPQSKLNLAHAGSGVGDPPRVGVELAGSILKRSAARNSEINVVQSIEELRSKLEVLGLRNFRLFDE